MKKWLFPFLILVLGFSLWKNKNPNKTFTKNQVIYEELGTFYSLSDKDFEKVAKLHDNCFSEARLWHMVNYHRMENNIQEGSLEDKKIQSWASKTNEETKETRREFLRSHPGATVGRLDGEIVSFYHCAPYPVLQNSIMLANVCVSPEERRKGLGTDLVRHALSHCTSHKESLFITIYDHHDHLKKFYGHLGFKPFPFPQGRGSYENFRKILMKSSLTSKNT